MKMVAESKDESASCRHQLTIGEDSSDSESEFQLSDEIDVHNENSYVASDKIVKEVVFPSIYTREHSLLSDAT